MDRIVIRCVVIRIIIVAKRDIIVEKMEKSAENAEEHVSSFFFKTFVPESW